MTQRIPIPHLAGTLVLGLIAAQGSPFLSARAKAELAGPSQAGLRSAAGPTELVLNGGYEQGGASWTLSSAAGVDVMTPTHSGSQAAWLLGNGTNGTGKVQQRIAIPATATSASLTFWTYTWSTDTSGSVCGQLDAMVIDGTARKRLGRWNDLGVNTNGSFVKRTYDLLAYKGKTITLSFEGTEWASPTGGAVGFHIDDVSLIANVSTTATPTITSFTPASGGPGTSVTINGTNFTGATAVRFNGATATFTVQSATQITATVPAGAANGPISVTTPQGTATSSASYTVNVSAPSITSFTPATGGPGTSVTINGTNFTGATAVRFNGTAATFTVQSATQITATVPAGATNGPIAVTTPQGTATSSASYTVNAAAPTISSFTPTSGSVGTSVTLTGTNFTGATAVRFNGVSATYTVTSATQITTSVPTTATTGPISVTTPSGTATSAASFTLSSGPDTLSVSKIEVGQATQRSNNSMRLAQDKRAYLRVFLKAASANSYAPTVLAQFFLNGAQTYQTTISRPGGLTGVPTAVPGEGDFDKTWNAIIPANILKPGLSVKVTADPSNQITDGNRANNVYPATGNLSLDVRNTYPFRLTIVPLSVYSGGTYWTPYIGATTDWTVMFQRIWPVPEALDVRVHSTYYPSNVPLADYSYGWDETLNELGALQIAEGTTNRYYYGAYSPYYGTGGGSGMAFLGSPQAMGVDWDMLSDTFTWKAGTVAHEIGHSLNRPHSPCGGPAEPDPGYPYSDGTLGTWGYDCWTDEWYNPANFGDVMGYCGYSWVSDYCVDKVMDFRLSGDPTVPGPVGPGPNGPETATAEPSKPVPVALVWGRMIGDQVQLNPTFTFNAVPTPNAKAGAYQVELVSASGQVLANAVFDPLSTDHGSSNVKNFVMAVPVQSGAPGAFAATTGPEAGISTVRVLRGSQEVASAKAKVVAPLAAQTAGASLPVAARRVEKGTQVEFTWNQNEYPMIMVKTQKGEVLTFGRGGRVAVPSEDVMFEVHVSDGASSRPVTVFVK